MDEEFRKKIIKDFSLESMDSRHQEEMIEKIGNLLFESVIERAIDIMDDEAMNEFDALIESAGNDYRKIIDFLNTKVAGFDKIVSDELSRLKRATSGIFA